MEIFVVDIFCEKNKLIVLFLFVVESFVIGIVKFLVDVLF